MAMRVNGIRLIGPGWTPEERRFQILARLPPDVADLIAVAALDDDDPFCIVYRLKKRTPALIAYVDEQLAAAEREIWAAECGDPALAEGVTFH
jgi:hypothetical protein